MEKLEINEKEIKDNLDFFKEGRESGERYASFDYCFNYFQDFKDKKEEIGSPENLQNSCLQLGFYLASWGMYRGSTFLLQKSVKVFEPLIKYISSKECSDIWEIDVGNYSEENIKKLLNCSGEIKNKLGIHKIKDKDKEATTTLVTKIMLGIFGNVPAFDQYFIGGSGLGTFNEEALIEITKFYKENNKIINEKSAEIKTLSYYGPSETNRPYTKAKIIDMIFFSKGFRMPKKKKLLGSQK